MNASEWPRLSSMRFHVIAGRDELVTASANLDAARSLAASLSASRKSAMQVSDTQNVEGRAQRGYIRFWNGREVERAGM